MSNYVHTYSSDVSIMKIASYYLSHVDIRSVKLDLRVIQNNTVYFLYYKELEMLVFDDMVGCFRVEFRCTRSRLEFDDVSFEGLPFVLGNESIY